MTDVPTFPDNAVGFRQWQVTDDGWLFGTGYSHLWRPGVNYAICGSLKLHVSPSEDCDCGCYAYTEPIQFDEENLLSGVIVVNGKLLTEQIGFRAEQAMIVALAIPPKYKEEEALARQAAERYGVPLIAFEDLELVASRYGVVPKMVNPPPDRLSAQEFKERKSEAEQRRHAFEVKALALIPEGPMLDIGLKPDVVRLRSIILLAARQSGGTTKDAAVARHWPKLAAGLTCYGSPEADARRVLNKRLESTFSYLRSARLIVGIKIPNGGMAKVWCATPDGDALQFKGMYYHEPHEVEIRQRYEARRQEQNAESEGTQLALPPPGPILALGILSLTNRYRTIVVDAALAAGADGITREAIQAQYWPALPIHRPRRSDIFDPPDAQEMGYHQLRDILDRTIHYLKNQGYIVGTPRTDEGFGKVWRATDKARKLQVVDEYVVPSPV
jgi:hypothetical protein